MTQVFNIFKSYIHAINPGDLLQRLPALVIALWLGVISISIIPHVHILEGGFLFLFFFITCLLIDSAMNPNKIKNPDIAQAIRSLGYRNYKITIGIHLLITITLAIHLTFILSKILIISLVFIGLTLSIINSRIISRSRSLEKINGLITVASGIAFPMLGAFFVVGNSLDIFTITILFGVSFIYLGIFLYENARSDLELAPGLENKNSIEWEAMRIVEELQLPNSRIKEIGLQLANIRNEPEFLKIPPEECILFLPHCLRNAERCKATYNDEGLQCKQCTKTCKIHQLTKLAEEKGFKCFVVPGGAMVFNIAKKYRPKGVVAVACLNELREGAARTESEYNVPFQIIRLTKDGCVNTNVCCDEVVDVMYKKFDEKYDNN